MSPLVLARPYDFLRVAELRLVFNTSMIWGAIWIVPGKIVVYVFSGILLFDNMTGHVIMKSEFYHDNAFTCVTSDNVSQCIKV